MSQRPKSSQSVALFPFLAVLVCTMGSLIFLLLVTTKMMRNIAIAQAEAAKNPPAMDVMQPAPSVTFPDPEPEVIPAAPAELPESSEPKIDLHALELAKRERELEELALLWRKRVDALSSQKADRSRLLQQKKLLQQASTQRLASLKNEAKEMEIKLGGMTGELSAAVMDSTNKEREELERKIAELKKRLLAAQQSQEADGAFQVVPFDVNTGTSRRPILIECTESGLRFIPEDVTVSARDLEGFTPQVNPLIAGASALVNYWTAWKLKQPNPAKEPEPYVLLMVRPSGTVAYYVAMKMLSNLKQPHGYELIEEGTVLQIPPVDLGSKAACEAAVKRLINERNQVMRATGSGGMGFGRGPTPDAFRGDGSKSGAKVVSSLKGGPGAGGSGSNGSPGGTPPGGMAGVPNGTGATGHEGGGGDKFELTDIVDSDGKGREDWDRVENFEGRPPRGAGSTIAGGGPIGSPRGSGGGTIQSPGGPPRGNSTNPGGADGLAAPGVSKGMAGMRPPSGPPEGQGTSNGPQNSDAIQSDPNAIGEAQGDGQQGSGQPGSQQVAGQKPGNQRNGTASKAGSVTGNPGTAGTQGSTGIESLDGSAGAENGSNQPGSAEQLDIGLGSPNRSPIPVQDLRRKRRKSSDKAIEFEPQQLASHHWGLSEPGASIGLEREVRVDAETERFVIAGKHAVTVEETDSRDNIFDRMVTVLDLQARDWGKPPQGFFWKPSLRIVVAKGGDANYDKIQPLLEQAGLSCTRESATKSADPPLVATAPEKPAATSTPAKPQPTTAPAPRIQRRSIWGFSR